MQPVNTIIKKNHEADTSLEGKILIYIGKQLKSRERLSEKESQDFLRYLGLDGKNLRKMLTLEDPFTELSGQEYGWNDLYGRKAVLDVEEYMKTEAMRIRNKLEKKAEDIINRIKQYLVPSLTKKGDAAFAAEMLDCTNPLGLYSLLHREKQLDYEYLKNINKQTYDEIREEDERARKERRGILGHREERIDDIFASVDNFLRQRYEIYRYKTMKSIYEKLLVSLEQHNVGFPEGDIPAEMEIVFERLDIYQMFSTDFLETLDAAHFLEDIPYEELRSYFSEIQSETQKEAVPTKRDISLIIEGIQNKCLVVEKKQAILSVYDIIGEMDYEGLSLKEKLELLHRIQQNGIKPVRVSYYQVNDERDYDSLLDNEEFMNTLLSSVEAVRTNKAVVGKLQRQL